MSNSDLGKTFTLDNLRAAASKKYASMFVPVTEAITAELVNYLRLDKETRKALKNLDKEAESFKGEESERDEAEHFAKMIRLVCRTSAQADALLEAVGDDLGLLAEIFETYTSNTQLGEASGSQN